MGQKLGVIFGGTNLGQLSTNFGTSLVQFFFVLPVKRVQGVLFEKFLQRQGYRWREIEI